MQKKQILLTATIIVLGGFGLSLGNESVVAQQVTDPEPRLEIDQIGIVFASFIVAGVIYSASGWLKKVRRKLAGENVPLDYRKMGKSVLIGVILGIAAMAWSAYEGDVIIITDAREFGVQVGLNMAVILLVDKLILGTAQPKAGPTGDEDEGDFDELESELPTEVPPGKSGNE